MPPGFSEARSYGKCKKCRGRGITIKRVIKVFPPITQCPKCKGKGGIMLIYNVERDPTRFPYPKEKLDWLDQRCYY